VTNLFGIIGTILLLIAWSMKITRFKKHWLFVNYLAAFLLMVHSYLIKDLVLIFVNGFISAISLWSYGRDRLNES